MGDCCAGNNPLFDGEAPPLPVIQLQVNKHRVRGLVDSGCTKTIVHSNLLSD